VRTEAEKHDYLVQRGAERFIETYLALFARMAEGGRTPGISVPSKAELRALYASTDDGYWAALNKVDPEGAQSQLKQWKQAQSG
jgi:hypothetical protein